MAQPEIIAVFPRIATNDIDQNIRINGSGFDINPKVYIGSQLASNITRPNSSVINCQVPNGLDPDSYDITVVNIGGEQYTQKNIYRVTFPSPLPPFDTESRTVITNRILEPLADIYDVYPGTFIYEFASSVGFELSKGYVHMADALNQVFPQTARSGYLDLIGEMFGILRERAQYSSGTLTINGVDGSNIPAGSIFTTSVTIGQMIAPISFVSIDEKYIVGDTVDVEVRAQTAGIIGNVNANQVVRVSSSISGINSVNNNMAFIGGENTESDNSYRIRVLGFVRNPIGGGNRQDYINWSLQVDGVKDVSVVPLNRGNGTVDVFVVGEGFPYLGEVEYGEAVAVFNSNLDTNSRVRTYVAGSLQTTYTFASAININTAANIILIEANLTDTLDNIINAMNAADGSGTKYGTPTVVNPDYSATQQGHNVIIFKSLDTSVTSGYVLIDDSTDNSEIARGNLTKEDIPFAFNDNGIDTVQDYISPVGNSEGAGLAPIGASVLIISPELEYVSVSVTITVDSLYDETTVINKVQENIENYINELKSGYDIMTIHIANIIHDTAGVINFTFLRVDGGIDDIVVIDTRKPYANSVIVST